MTITLTQQRAATRGLPRPVVGIIPAYLERTISQICGFVPVACYGPHKAMHNEVGSVEYVRYVVRDSADALLFLSGEEAQKEIDAQEPWLQKRHIALPAAFIETVRLEMLTTGCAVVKIEQTPDGIKHSLVDAARFYQEPSS